MPVTTMEAAVSEEFMTRVRIKRSDFDHLVEAGYSGTKETPEREPNLSDGEVPDPEVP